MFQSLPEIHVTSNGPLCIGDCSALKQAGCERRRREDYNTGFFALAMGERVYSYPGGLRYAKP